MKAYKMLIRWKEDNTSKATYKVMYNALCHNFVKRRDLAEEFCCDLKQQFAVCKLRLAEIAECASCGHFFFSCMAFRMVYEVCAALVMC